MSKNVKYWLLFLGSSLGGLVLFMGMSLWLMPAMYYPNQTTIYSGEQIVLTTNGPVDMIATTDRGTGTSTIYDENNQAVLTTKAGLREGYYEGQAKVETGTYKLKGDLLGLEFRGDNFVKVENPYQKQIDFKMGITGWLAFSLVMLVFTRSIYRQDVRRK